jgi:hypothetical protein
MNIHKWVENSTSYIDTSSIPFAELRNGVCRYTIRQMLVKIVSYDTRCRMPRHAKTRIDPNFFVCESCRTTDTSIRQIVSIDLAKEFQIFRKGLFTRTMKTLVARQK